MNLVRFIIVALLLVGMPEGGFGSIWLVLGFVLFHDSGQIFQRQKGLVDPEGYGQVNLQSSIWDVFLWWRKSCWIR